jgi:epoxyqueuosine reductase
MSQLDFNKVAAQIRAWSKELGFDALGITDPDLTQHEAHLQQWLDAEHQGEMDYMARHGMKRARPEELVPGTVRIISVRMNYLPPAARPPHEVLRQGSLGYVSRYALGRDYHKLMRHRLQKLALRIEELVGPYEYRAFVDSAPVLEKALAEKSGLGWIGKHSNLLSREAGSWFFLGELFTNLPLPVDSPVSEHCGRCTACIDICPTQAIIGPYQVDARRCISYLTIELRGPIPLEFRSQIGNRIYGCDDCQLVCPWNRFARTAALNDFSARHGLDAPSLIDLFNWDEQTFLRNMEGSAIRRIGHEAWLRNIAVALGNAPSSPEIITALDKRMHDVSPMVQEHIRWALDQHGSTVLEQ